MISQKQVQHIAKLARLGLTPSEIKKAQKELSSILDYIVKLEEIDVSSVEATSHPHLLENVLRQDEPEPEDASRVNKLVELAPAKKTRYVKVKQVL